MAVKKNGAQPASQKLTSNEACGRERPAGN